MPKNIPTEKDAEKALEANQKEEIYRELSVSEEQIQRGETRDAKEALANLRKKYGL